MEWKAHLLFVGPGAGGAAAIKHRAAFLRGHFRSLVLLRVGQQHKKARRHPVGLESVSEALRQHKAELSQNARYYNEQGLKAKEKEFEQAEVTELIPRAVNAAPVRKTVAHSKFDNLVNGMVDTDADAAQESRNDRFLDQSRRTITADDDPSRQISRAREVLGKPELDRNQRGLLAKELDVLFPGNDWVQPELTRVDPVRAEVHAEVHNADQSYVLINQAANVVQTGIATSTPVSKQFFERLAPAVAKWDPDAVA